MVPRPAFLLRDVEEETTRPANTQQSNKPEEPEGTVTVAHTVVRVVTQSAPPPAPSSLHPNNAADPDDSPLPTRPLTSAVVRPSTEVRVSQAIVHPSASSAVANRPASSNQPVASVSRPAPASSVRSAVASSSKPTVVPSSSSVVSSITSSNRVSGSTASSHRVSSSSSPSASPSSEASNGRAKAGSSAQQNAGLIAGAVIAAILALGLIAFLVWTFLRRRKKDKFRPTSVEAFVGDKAGEDDVHVNHNLPAVSYHQQWPSEEGGEEKWREEQWREQEWQNQQMHGGDQAAAGYWERDQQLRQQSLDQPQYDQQNGEGYYRDSRQPPQSMYGGESMYDYYGDSQSVYGGGRSRAGSLAIPPPVPKVPSRKNSDAGFSSSGSEYSPTGTQVYGGFGDVHLSPPHSPGAEPSGHQSKPSFGRQNTTKLADLIKARVGRRGNAESNAQDLESPPKSPTATESDKPPSEGYTWMPAFLRGKRGSSTTASTR